MVRLSSIPWPTLAETRRPDPSDAGTSSRRFHSTPGAQGRGRLPNPCQQPAAPPRRVSCRRSKFSWPRAADQAGGVKLSGMPDLPEPPNETGFAAFSGRTGEDSAVTMLNLLEFKAEGGRERYAEYGAAVAPLLEKAGARVVFAGDAGPALLGEGSWDMVLLVEYPDRGAFLEMIGSDDYQAIAHLRTEALARGELHPLDGVEVPVG